MTKYKAKLSETSVMKVKTSKRGQIVSVVFMIFDLAEWTVH